MAADNQRAAARGGKRKKARGLFKRWVRMSLKHTWINPLVLVLLVLGSYFASPGEHNPLHSAIYLSYPNPALNERTDTIPSHIGDVTQYGKGRKDFAFVAFYVAVFSFTREFLMQRMIRPIAIRCGIRNRGKQSRFMEQFYTALYFAVFGPFGLYVMSRTPVWYFNTTGMYEGFPHRAHEAMFKAYYLLQAAYWAQQGLVLMLQLEKPRKDFKELVLHHVVTLALIGLSYRFHFTYMGIAVYITHDISDFFLAVSVILHCRNTLLTAISDVQDFELPRFPLHRTLLRVVYVDLGLPSSLHQFTYSLLLASWWRVPNSRPLRVELGNTAVQELGCSGNRISTTGYPAGRQFVLVLPDLQDSVPHHKHR